MSGWIPLRLTLDAAVNDATEARLRDACPGAEMETVETFDAEPRELIGRGRQRDVSRRIRMRYEPNADKLTVYAESIRALLAEQVAYVRDPSRRRRVTEQNGRDSLALAEAAAKLADARRR